MGDVGPSKVRKRLRRGVPCKQKYRLYAERGILFKRGGILIILKVKKVEMGKKVRRLEKRAWECKMTGRVKRSWRERRGRTSYQKIQEKCGENQIIGKWIQKQCACAGRQVKVRK